MFKSAYIGMFLCVSMTVVFADPNELRLPQIIGDNMVLQQGKALTVWGWARPGEIIYVKIKETLVKARTNQQGVFAATLPPMEAGGPYMMKVRGDAKVITLSNIMLGEVWICSGQFNMETPMYMSRNAQMEISRANVSSLRLFRLPKEVASKPLLDTNASWEVCNPKSVVQFSAAAYYFGSQLHKELGMPIGLIQSAYHFSNIEAWTPTLGLESVPQLRQINDEVKRHDFTYRTLLKKELGPFKQWLQDTEEALKSDAPIEPMPPCERHPLESAMAPTGVYNAMIHPLINYRIRGVIWHQGVQNIGDGLWYFYKMKGLMQGWRQAWRQGDFPFYFVQLAPYRFGGRRPTEKAPANPDPLRLARFWDAQRRVLRLPNTGMVVTTDIGDINTLFPQNKKEVGRRLGLWALNKTYGKTDLVCSGPLFKSMSIEGNKVRLEFDHTGSGLASRDGQPLDWFEVAGSDDRYVEAEAEIQGRSVLVWSDRVKSPTSVRFAWNQIASPNLINKEGLPASPFKTK